MRLVIVEDETFARRSLIKLIGQISEDYTVIGEAKNGLEASEIIKRVHPDVVITDIKMPDMNGLDLIQEMIKEGIKSSYIIISGYSDFEFAKKAISFGVKEYIVKPFTYQELSSVLSRISHQIDSIYQRSVENIPNSVLPSIEASHPIVSKAIRIICDNMDKPCTLTEVSQILAVSPEHVSRIFHAETNLKFSTYVSAAKIDHAMCLMRNTDYKTSKISQLCGFQNVKYFYKVFKSLTGMSTGDYQALCRGADK